MFAGCCAAQSSVPIIMLTARVEETDRLIGLEVGAHDYIVKRPFPRVNWWRVRVRFCVVPRGEVQSTGIIRILVRWKSTSTGIVSAARTKPSN